MKLLNFPHRATQQERLELILNEINNPANEYYIICQVILALVNFNSTMEDERFQYISSDLEGIIGKYTAIYDEIPPEP